MRRMAILAIVLDWGASGAALAAPPATRLPTDQALAKAAFTSHAAQADTDPIDWPLDRESYVPGAGLYASRIGEAALPGSSLATLRIRESLLVGAPGELPLSRRAEVDPQTYEVTVIRKWPGLSFDAGRLAVDLAPHAGLGVIGGDRTGGGSAEAGATLQLSRSDLAAARLKALGVRDGAAFGDRGRWYLFAAASGRAVGLNMLRSDTGWNRAGWSTDPTSRLVGDAQLGIGWRRGAMQTSVGLVHREVKGQHMLYGVDPKSDSMVAFSLSIRPWN
jgi:hypothetical protein